MVCTATVAKKRNGKTQIRLSADNQNWINEMRQRMAKENGVTPSINVAANLAIWRYFMSKGTQ